MPVTINVNQLSLVHQGSGGISIATLPDVCLTPAPPAPPVPVPYPNVALSADLAQGTTTVFADGGNSCAISPSVFSTSVGDEAGVIGGVASGTTSMDASWLTFSPDVKIEGQAATRLTDKMLQNHGNTMTNGEHQPLVHTFDPVDDAVVWSLIKKFMQENNQDVCAAFGQAQATRNGTNWNGIGYKADCYNTNLAAADHYLFARCKIAQYAKGDPDGISAFGISVRTVGYDDLKGILYGAGWTVGLLGALMGDSDAPSDLGNAVMNLLAGLDCPVTPPSFAQIQWAKRGVQDQTAEPPVEVT